MKLTIVIVNWNTRDLLLGCLRAVRSDAEALGAEVVVVDNGSEDGSPESVRQECPWARLIETGENLGFARANNLAIAQTAGEYVLLLNSDTEMAPGALQNLVTAMEQAPEVAAASACLILPDGSYQPGIGGALPSLSTMANYYLFLSRLFPRRFPGLYARQTDVAAGRADLDWVCGACMIVRRRAIEEVGVMSEGFFMYAEDVEWCQRFRAKGWRVMLVPAARVLHYHGASSKRKGLKSASWLNGMHLYLTSRFSTKQVRMIHLVEATGFLLRGLAYLCLLKWKRALEMFSFTLKSLELTR